MATKLSPGDITAGAIALHKAECSLPGCEHSYRVIVTGSRTWSKPDIIRSALNGILAFVPVGLPMVVVHGQCDPLNPRTRRRIPWATALALPLPQRSRLLGADWHASQWVREAARITGSMTVGEEAHPANWHPGGKFDRTAGFGRNGEMIDSGAREALAFLDRCMRAHCGPGPHGSHGTEHCAKWAERAGIPVRRFGDA